MVSLPLRDAVDNIEAGVVVVVVVFSSFLWLPSERGTEIPIDRVHNVW